MPFNARATTTRLLPLFIVVGLLAMRPATTHAATAAQVEESLQSAVAWLYKQQKDGTWEDLPAPDKDANDQHPNGGQYTGRTALAVYALLSAGQSPQDPRLAKAIELLLKTPTEGTYALGIRLQVYMMLNDTPEVRAAAKRDAAVLLRSIKAQGSSRGMYSYALDPGGKDTDYSHSRSQYGVLGIWAADQMGVEIPSVYWKVVEDAWIDHQDKSGGWTYKKVGETEHALTPGMTAVGVATLFITQDYTRAAEGLPCKGNIFNPAIEKGLKWMGDHMNMVANDKAYSRDYPYPTLYAVERIGVAGGQKYFGNVDWFKQGSDWLIRKQGKGGNWTGNTPLAGSLGDTAFAMLFLARGRSPVAINKLDYAAGESGPQSPPWNQRPRDVANIARWIGKQIERDLNWQIVNLQAAPAQELLDAPILYISGNKPLVFDDAQKEKLRQFVYMGGIILGNADCGAMAFSSSFTKLGQELFPQYEFRELPDNHPIYTGNFRRANWNVKPSVLGMSNGSRELMLLVPTGDPARWWQTRMTGGKEPFWQLGAAIFMYVSEGKDLRFRGDTHLVAADTKIKPTRSLRVARLQYAGNWDPEPGGWWRIKNIVHNANKLDLNVETVKLGDGKLGSTGVAHLTGTAKFTLPVAAREEIKAFVAGGGTLLIDACGGSSAFAEAAEAELAAMFPGNPAAVLPPDSPLFAAGGKPIEAFVYRTAAKALVGTARVPRVKAITIDGRLAVVYSREDLSTGIVGQSVEGVLGYDPDTAAAIMQAVLANAAPKDPSAGKPPTTKPATPKPATPKPAAKPVSK